MRVACPNCQARYNLDERKLPPGGAKVRCPKCKGAIVVRPPVPGDEDAAGAPAAPPGAGAVPLPDPGSSAGSAAAAAPIISPPAPPTLAPPTLSPGPRVLVPDSP